jgi:hypothetical protein
VESQEGRYVKIRLFPHARHWQCVGEADLSYNAETGLDLEQVRKALQIKKACRVSISAPKQLMRNFNYLFDRWLTQKT